MKPQKANNKLNPKTHIHHTVNILPALIISLAISGCHPCSLVQCGSYTTITVSIRKNGDIYFDLPKKPEYKNAKLDSFSISQLRNENFNSYYWSIRKGFNENESMGPKDSVKSDFPFKYGEVSSGTITEIPAKKIDHGRYKINGTVFLAGNREAGVTTLTGEFEYTEDAINNFQH